MLREEARQAIQVDVEWWQHVAARMLRCRTVAELLDLAYDAVRGGLGYSRVSLFLVAPERRVLVEHIATDERGGKVYPIDRALPLDDGLYARILSAPAMQPDGAGFLHYADVTYHRPGAAPARAEERPSTLYVALRTPTAVLGLLAVANAPGAPMIAHEEMPPLLALATSLALAIENVYLRSALTPPFAAVEESPSAAAPASERAAPESGGRGAASDVDALTGLVTHRALIEQLDGAITAARPFTLVLLDIDNFSLFNDTYGHEAGDRVLGEIAAALRQVCRDDDVAARFGGDEFAVLLRDIEGARARAVARRLESMVRARPHVTRDGGVIPLSIAVGFACFADDSQSRRDIVSAADASLAAARRGSRARPRPRYADLLDKNHVAVLNGLVTAVDSKDRYTREHSEEVTRGALLLAEKLGLDVEQRRVLALAGPLHDVGKIAVPDRILRKPGNLTRHEYDVMKHHVAFGVAIVQGVLPDAAVIDAIAHHHERWDGGGYPYGIKGAEAPLLGRVMQIADAASAMRVHRPYRRGLPWARIVAELREGAGLQFDPDLVEPFIEALARVRRPLPDTRGEPYAPRRGVSG